MNKETENILHQKFDNLYIGQCMELPISMVKPITINDYTSSHTEGPIEVFRNTSGNLYIDDGNHRYFEYKRKLLQENHFQEPNYDEVIIEVKKVYPINTWLNK